MPQVLLLEVQYDALRIHLCPSFAAVCIILCFRLPRHKLRRGARPPVLNIDKNRIRVFPLFIELLSRCLLHANAIKGTVRSVAPERILTLPQTEQLGRLLILKHVRRKAQRLIELTGSIGEVRFNLCSGCFGRFGIKLSGIWHATFLLSLSYVKSGFPIAKKVGLTHTLH
jgi:hypothetical protein